MTKLFWGFWAADIAVIVVYFALGFLAIKKEKLRVYEIFCYSVLLVMMSKIVFTVLNA